MSWLKHITGAADLASEGEPGSWVNDAAREEFMAAYDRVFARWPRPREDFDIDTAAATTRVHAYRPHPDGAPVVLLTGAGGNAAFWFPHVAALAEDGPVYGIDLPGDANPSVPRTLITPPASCAAWLDELLGKLSGRPVHLVGFSYGGWVALNQALRAPGRVASLTLLDPAGLTRPDARFYRWLTISGLATLTPMPLRRRLARWLDLRAPRHRRARGSLMPQGNRVLAARRDRWAQMRHDGRRCPSTDPGPERWRLKPCGATT